MKIYRLFGALVVCAALAVMFGCGSGSLGGTDGSVSQGGIGDGEQGVEVSGAGDGNDLLLASADGPVCIGNAILPPGKNAYYQHMPNQLINSRTPFFYNLMMDQINEGGFDEGIVPKYGDWEFGGQASNNWAIFHKVFDERMSEVIGVGIGDVNCVVGAFENISGQFCEGGEFGCFSSWSNIQERLEQIPFIGTILRMFVNIIPKQYQDMLAVFNILPAPDPYGLTMELLNDTEFQIVVDGWQLGSLARLQGFMQLLFANFDLYQQRMEDLLGAGDRKNLAVPPNFSLMIGDAPKNPVIEWGEGEHDNCFTATVGAGEVAKSIGVDFAVSPFGDDGMVLEFCEYDGFLTIATIASADEIRNQAVAYLANQNPTSLLDDQCYRQTYHALWNKEMDTRAPDLLACANVHDMQLDLLPYLNGLKEGEIPDEAPGGNSPFVSFMPIMDENIELFRVGLLASFDYKSEFKASVQLFEPTEGVIFSRGDKAANADTIMGYNDVEFGGYSKVSSKMTDAIRMESYLGEDVLDGMDGYNLPAVIMLVFEQVLSEYETGQ